MRFSKKNLERDKLLDSFPHHFIFLLHGESYIVIKKEGKDGLPEEFVFCVALPHRFLWFVFFGSCFSSVCANRERR